MIIPNFQFKLNRNELRPQLQTPDHTSYYPNEFRKSSLDVRMRFKSITNTQTPEVSALSDGLHDDAHLHADIQNLAIPDELDYLRRVSYYCAPEHPRADASLIGEGGVLMCAGVLCDCVRSHALEYFDIWSDGAVVEEYHLFAVNFSLLCS